MPVFSRGARKKHRRRTPRFLTTSAPAPCPPSCDNRPVTHIRHALALAAAFALALPSAAQTITTIAFPIGLGLDGKGNLYVVDSINARIRKIEGVAAR